MSAEVKDGFNRERCGQLLGPAGLGHAQPVTVELLCTSPLIEIDKLPSGRLTSVDHLVKNSGREHHDSKYKRIQDGKDSP